MAIATENFNRADNTQLSGHATTTGALTWTTLTGGAGDSFDTFGMFVGAAAASTSNLGTCSGATFEGSFVDAGVADVVMTATYAGVGSGTDPQGIGFLLRIVSATPDYLRIGYQENGHYFEAVDVYGGLPHNATAHVPATIVVGDVISVEVSGSSVTLKQNGVAVLTATGIHNTTATKHGIYSVCGYSQAFLAKPAMDNWSIDSFSAPVLRPTPQSPIVVAQTVPRASIW